MSGAIFDRPTHRNAHTHTHTGAPPTDAIEAPRAHGQKHQAWKESKHHSHT